VLLLDVSRITGGNLCLLPVPCDLAIVVKTVIETFADAARHAGSRIDTDLPPSLPGTWDQLALEQIIGNLVSNAIKYGASRPVMVRLTGSDDAVHLQFRDRGPGMSTEHRGRIFEHFERVVGPSDRHSGFGIGLWVIRHLVEAMHGTIAVEDAQGGGTIVDVALPRHVAVSPS
jgi:signal transduction histidine kinase